MAKILVINKGNGSESEICEILSSEGHSVERCKDCIEGAGMLEADACDIVITDFSTTESCDARELSKVRNASENAVIIVVSMEATQEIISESLRNNVFDYIAKPFNRAAISRSVANAEQVKKIRDEALAYKNDLKNVIDDLTKQLIHAQRLSSIGTMLMEVLHEIKNQMTLISIGGQTIEEILPEFENFLRGRIEATGSNKERCKFVLNELSNCISNIKSGINRTMRITNSFGNYTFRGGEEDIGCDINECIMQALELCKGRLKKNVRVLTKLGEELPAVRADQQLVQQVLVNLLLNSADAIESNGKGKVEIETLCGKENMCVELRDDGPGIPEDKVERIWDAFYTTKHNGKGNGLGLSVSKGIIEGLGGSITAKNSSEGGAIFTIEIPAKKEM